MSSHPEVTLTLAQLNKCAKYFERAARNYRPEMLWYDGVMYRVKWSGERVVKVDVVKQVEGGLLAGGKHALV